MRTFAHILAAISTIFALTATTSYAGTVTVSDPTKTGTDVFEIKILTFERNVEVPVTAADTDVTKARILRDAINALFEFEVDPAKRVATITTDGTVNIANGTALLLQNPSGELRVKATALSDTDFEGGLGFAIIDYHGSLSGVDADGFESLFAASLGFDGLIASANLSFGQLSSPDIEGLLADIFNDLFLDLPAIWQPNLTLDLSRERIVFALPSGEMNYFVDNFASDISTEVTGGLTSNVVSEPGSLALFALGLASLGYSNWRVRDLRGLSGELTRLTNA